MVALGERLPCGFVKCKLCNRWCVSRSGLAIHYGKAHIKRPKAPKPKPRPITLWDLKNGRRLNQ